jgi:hypothetical protein
VGVVIGNLFGIPLLTVADLTYRVAQVMESVGMSLAGEPGVLVLPATCNRVPDDSVGGL